MVPRYLDLNTRNVLEHWTVTKAVIELVANAIDEANETKTRLPVLEWEAGRLHLRDAGRGLKTEHFQQQVNPAKLANPLAIGKFGVGLKDALSVLFNNGRTICIESRFLYIEKMLLRSKHDFENEAIHIVVNEPRDKEMLGTSITIEGITKREYRKVRSYFQLYTELGPALAETPAGKLYRRQTKSSGIFINGIRVNEENDFLYQYAIFSDSKSIMDALSRDRDRNTLRITVYAEKVQQILIYACKYVQEVRDQVRELFLNGESSNYHELSYKKLVSLSTELVACELASTPPRRKLAPASMQHLTEEAEQVTSTKSEHKKEETKPRLKIIIREDEETTKLFERGHAILSKLTTTPPSFYLGTALDAEEGLFFEQKDLRNEKVFLRRMMRKYLAFCRNDPDEESSLVISLVTLLSKEESTH